MAITDDSRERLIPASIALILVLLAAQSVSSQQAPRPRTLDDLFTAVAELVPAFGGMYRGDGGTLHVNLLDTSPNTVQAAEKAIRAIFGQRAIAPGGLRPNKASFGFLDLKRLHDQARPLFAIDGVVLTDIDERKNRLRIGLYPIGVQSEVENRGVGGLRRASVEHMVA